jgi:hypothetical protein
MGGYGIVAEAGRQDVITGNSISNMQNSSTGYAIKLGTSSAALTNSTINQNSIYNCRFALVTASQATYNTFSFNNIISCSSTISDAGNFNSFIQNIGYNPKGYLANPFSSNGKYLVDAGNNATWSSGVTYTCIQSLKTIIIYNATGITWNAQALTVSSLATVTVTLQSYDTIAITFDGASGTNCIIKDFAQ